MIEFCSKKRMAVAIVLLLSLTVVTLIVEGMWSTKHKLAEVHSETDESKCSADEIVIIESCKPCTKFELTSGLPVCDKTGYREEVKCKDKDPFKRSCRMDPWVEEKKFWILQLLTCAVGIGSYGIVKYRQNKLDKLLTEKVNRQIAA